MRKLLLVSMMIICAPSLAKDEFYLVKSGDSRMEEAMSKAKSTLTHFLKMAKERPARYDAYGAYIKFEENGETEFLWLVDVKPYDEKYLMGVVISEPRLIKRYQYGQTIGFLPSDIYDWQLKDSKSGEITGAFTICAMSDPGNEDDVKYIKENKFKCKS
ncbi:MAG: DUF2314 domain-containing protein [Pseudomonadota bacterium]|nr:DUF2314 domain-containing protein [Pseudomonadota bacterium]